ncbi:MAG: hypothetical protein Q9182_003356 [Xanthomendoza sp. 2 TL-2023]
MQDIDRRLFDRRRHDGTACVLLHGQPGGGKSHLARQYVNKNRKKFIGGVFWIVSHLKEERDQAYEAIFQKAVVRESPDANTRLKESGSSFVESVKAWFESRQEWLIVFDGVALESDADITELAKFVPDSRNSRYTDDEGPIALAFLIYVSRQSNLATKQRLLRPYAIRVPVLKVDDARKLLFKELSIKRPSEVEIKHATKLVKQVDCLPLVINAISHQISYTREPLVRYSVKSFSANPKLDSTYSQILDDLQRLGYMNAWNLISILAFYGQHVPVEMLHLGVRALQDVEIRSTEGAGKPDLNVTFGILMRHALLERNEPESETSSSRDSLVEPEPIDMLKMWAMPALLGHSVVQSFCRDSLDGKSLLPEWLQHATQLLERSFHAADFKIKQKEQTARVSDYRYYLILYAGDILSRVDAKQVHCRRLYEHARHYESTRQSLAPIRAVLEPLLEAIESEIRSLEPGSSQESVNKVCQVSIFDRTTSSSDSGPSDPSINEPRTPHRPSPLPLNETLWGMDIRKPSLESPASIGSARGPRVVGNSPYHGLYDEPGYESDRETPRFASHPMRKNISERTARPQIPVTEDHIQEDDGWQVVSSTRRGRKPRDGRDLGSHHSFRPTPARATRAEVDRRSATGTVTRSTERRKDSSEARRALSEVHSRSPTPPRQKLSSNLVSFWQRRPLTSTSNSQRTWANVAAGQVQHPQVQPLAPIPIPPMVPPSPTHPSTRHGQPFSSPLTSEFISEGQSNPPSLQDSGHLSARSNYDVSPRTQPSAAYYPSPASGSSTNLSQPRYIHHETLCNPSPPTGPNPSRLPYTNIDDSISISAKRRLPSEFHNDISPTPYPPATTITTLQPTSTQTPPPRAHSQSPSSYPRYEPYYPYTTSQIPSGYYSQPLSRDTSHQSHTSAAETEPLHFPSHSPYQPSPNYTNHAVGPSTPRERHPNGRPLHKSPRSEIAVPISKLGNNMPEHPDYMSRSLPGLGSWTASYANAEHPMSRSSSGPGIAFEDATGLGIIPFEGHLRFGGHEPIDVEQARIRAWEWEERLARDAGSRERSRARRVREAGGAVGYPEVNLIPTQSSPDAMRGMIGETERR